MRVRTNDPKKKKSVVAGEIKNGEYHRKVKNAHYMVKYHGYGIQSTILSDLVYSNVRAIFLHLPTGKVLKAPIAAWLDKGVTAEYGHGLQVFLPVAEMEEVRV